MLTAVHIGTNLIFLVSLLQFVNCQIYVGDLCTLTRTGQTGQCQLLATCKAAIKDLASQIYPQNCGFEGSRPVVCCAGGAPVTRPPSTATTTRASTPKPVNQGNVRVDDKSRQKSCYTPDGQQGHCVPLNECPKVFDIFANPPRGSETYLRQFLCTEVEQLKVCCGTAANFTLLEDDLPRSGFSDIFISEAFNRCYHNWLPDIDLALIVRASKDSDVEDKRCLGILVNPRYAITPAQCIGQQFTRVRVKFRGKNNDSPTFGIEEVISHPFFDPVTGINDIALLRLNQTVSEDNVPAVCFGEEYPGSRLVWEKSMFTYANLTVSTIERGLSKTTVSITSLSNEKCEEHFQQKGAHVVLTDHDVCLENVQNVTKFTCNEFTGVPLFLKDEENAYAGFSSSRTVCNDDLPIIYTNVYAYYRWLLDQMKPWPINNDPCTAPNGEIGECHYLSHCPSLLGAFSSVTNATEAYLRGFICDVGYEGDFPVCCVTSSNLTIVLKKDELKLDDVPIKFLETRLCGMQHRDDYFSSSAAIAIDEFPWLAVIRSEFQFVCTGALINSRYVISSARSLQVRVYSIIIHLGNYNLNNETSCVKDPDIDATDCTEEEKYGVEERILHPFYTRFGLNNIGLLRLNKTVTYTDFIRPICLPIPGTRTPKVGDTMYMSSWGFRRGDRSKFGIKKKVLTQLVHEEECKRHIRGFSNNKTLNIICTVDYQNNTDIADSFDQGAPLMFDNNYQWYITGLLWLDKKDTIAYVNVLNYINWIIESMEPW